jgi:predicted TIM-barrel fold metal-dependent hydrolase
MRKIDLHAYPGTKEWIDCQGPYVEALATYWKREWKPAAEADVIAEFEKAGVDVCLVALDLSTTIGTPPCSNDYVAALRDRYKCIVQAWGALEPAKGQAAIDEARHAVRDLKMMGFHFHPIMQHFAVDDRRYYPLFDEITALKVPVMIDVGMTGMGAGMKGGMGAKTRHAHLPPSTRSLPTFRISPSSWRTRAIRGSRKPRQWRCTRGMSSGKCPAGRRYISRPRSCATCAGVWPTR